MRGIKRTLVIAVAAGCCVAAAPAQADFHLNCSGPANALASLALDGSELVGSGTVNCPGATYIRVDYVTVSGLLSESTAPPQDCEECDTLTSSARIAALPGPYQVSFNFYVEGNGFIGGAQRSSRWLWVVGNPIKLCGRDAPPNPLGC